MNLESEIKNTQRQSIKDPTISRTAVLQVILTFMERNEEGSRTARARMKNECGQSSGGNK